MEKEKMIEQNESINIKDLFSKEELTETNQGYKMECPSCGLQGGRTEGFIITPDMNIAYCHSSGKWFRMLEAYSLKKKIIRCLDGREKGDNDSKILGGELFTLTLDEFKNEFGTEKFNKLLEQLNIRKPIELPGNNRLISDFSDDIGDIYKSRNVLFFRNELRDIVEIHRYKKNNEGKEYIENGFKHVDGNRFITLAEMFIKPWTIIYTKLGDSRTVYKSMNQSIANITLASPNLQNKLPNIIRIFDIQFPILYNGKLTFPKKGYDKRFASWLPYNAPEIKENIITLEKSKELIDKIFEEFCFKSNKDKTHAIAAFITPFLRGLFPKFSTRTPIFIYMANRERAGKDYCAGCSGILYEGVCTEEPPISNDEKSSNSNEEIRKKIMACMIQGKKRFHSANNKGLLNNAVFEGVTTAETWNDRILGKSENVTFNNEMDYSLSGNLGIRLTPDLANRGRLINLHLMDEDANARIFKNPRLHECIFENRSLIISALYTFVKHWVDIGMPKGSLPFTSFPYWAEICGGIMESVGYDNPCKKDDTVIISLDFETEEMKQLFEICYEHHPDKELNKNDIQEIIVNESIMPNLDFNNKSDQIKLGLRIDKYINRILSNILMKVDSLEQRSARRKYSFTKNIYTLGNDGNVDMAEKDTTQKDTTQKCGNDGNFGNDSPSPPITLYCNNEPNIRHYQDCHHYQKPNNFLKNNEITPKLVVESDNWNDWNQHNISSSKLDRKPKSDRELQFYESPETKDIVITCSKEEVLNLIKTNSGVKFEVMVETLGNGSLKWIGELLNEFLIKPLNDGWEVVNG